MQGKRPLDVQPVAMLFNCDLQKNRAVQFGDMILFKSVIVKNEER